MVRATPFRFPWLPPRMTSVAVWMLLFFWHPLASAQSSPRLDVPYVPTPVAVVERMLALGQVGPEDYLIDLGSGDGRIAIAAASERGAHALGIDIDPVRIQEARENAKRAGVSQRVEFRRQDIFQTDFSKATVLTLYLLPEINLRLRPRILDSLAPGTHVVSHAFTMGDWVPDHQEQVGMSSLYLWIVPAKVGGDWRISSRDEEFTISLKQSFQKLTGEIPGTGRLKLTEANLSGNRIRLTVQDPQRTRVFTGWVEGNTIRTMAGDGVVSEWKGARL